MPAEALIWAPAPLPGHLPTRALERLCVLIWENTQEMYTAARLTELPVSVEHGSALLVPAAEATRGSGLSQVEAAAGLLWTHPVNARTVRVLAFLVAEDRRGEGWGAAAWEHLLRCSHALGLEQVTLEVRADNDWARAFYERRGLNVTSTIPAYYGVMDGLRMDGPLRPPASG